MSVGERLARPGGLSYVHLPATDVGQAARFYAGVFGWAVRDADSDRPSFDDGTGHVAGAWMTDQEVNRKPGILLYIYVDDIDDAVRRIVGAGGTIVAAPEDEGTLRVARFRDPSGNVLGLWQETDRG